MKTGKKADKKSTFGFKAMKIDLVEDDTLILQVVPGIAGMLVGGIVMKIDDVFQISSRNPYFGELTGGITLLIWSLSFLVAIVRQEFYQALAVFRGKAAVVMGVLGFASLLFLGGGLLVRFVLDTWF